jgi:ribosome hibernation promoting factor
MTEALVPRWGSLSCLDSEGIIMDVTISGRHVDVTDAMRDHARDHVEKLGEHSPHLMRVSVTLAIEGERHVAEVIGGVRGRGDVVAKHESHDMYLSIDQAVSKVERQLEKLEAKYREHRGPTPVEPAATSDADDGDDYDEYEDE